MHDSPLSLRERNRLETWRAVHEAASALALEDGLAAATVDSIARRAGISKRTFFNYFPSKEDAVLGMRAPELRQEFIERFRASDAELLERTVRLMAEVLSTVVGDGSRFERRKELVGRYPELRGRVVQHLNDAEVLVDSAVNDRLSEDPATVSAELGEDPAARRALLMAAATIVRFTYRQFPGAPLEELGAHLGESTDVFRKVLRPRP
ncbi:TetR/AcrR family transcriptional regulator [Zafaria sp. Z1313]|uniref:TetR/AcrR family transcriptional regulator n=1 Tax=unclassified Zafaria TaxID=2828765 RepID=UPI002E7A5CAC|nr:TetR family transcriptional regulator [Zafaria sp. J156]MEE1620971.1 TetR family transcriptional regulator [Zafaria sp. J156]